MRKEFAIKPPLTLSATTICSAVAQLVEQETVNLLVTGSSPVRGAIFLKIPISHQKSISL